MTHCDACYCSCAVDFQYKRIHIRMSTVPLAPISLSQWLPFPPVMFLVSSPFLGGLATPNRVIMRDISPLSSSLTTTNSSTSLFANLLLLPTSYTRTIPLFLWSPKLHYLLARMECSTRSTVPSSNPLQKTLSLPSPLNLHTPCSSPGQLVASTAVAP